MIGERLAKLRKRAGLTQIDLAIELGGGYDQSVISRVESNQSSLRFESVVRAARIFGVSIDYLVGLTDDPTPAAELTAANRTCPKCGHELD